MAPSERLKPVRGIAERRERTAAQAYTNAQRALQSQQDKLEQLRQFQQEYQGQFDAACRGGLSVGELQEYRAFLARLQQAVSQQETAVETSHQAHLDTQRRWQAQHVRTQAIGKAIERLRSEESQDQERREQKESDEYAQRKGHYKG